MYISKVVEEMARLGNCLPSNHRDLNLSPTCTQKVMFTLLTTAPASQPTPAGETQVPVEDAVSKPRWVSPRRTPKVIYVKIPSVLPKMSIKG